MQDELMYVLALQDVPGIGDVLAKQLISYCGSAKAVFEETKGKLSKIPHIGQATIKSITNHQTLVEAEKCMETCHKQDIQVLPYYHKHYPSKLKLANDAPLLVFYKGAMSYPRKKVVGIVGTRKATEYGKETTEKIVSELVAHDVLVVSGLAYGIDIASHRAALDYGLPTVGVLAGGLDKVYPMAHRKTAQDMLGNGGIVSEYRPGVEPEAHYFPARNRIIAGMCDALIVVEAATRGGALITAHIAYSYDREVFAVPGSLTNVYSEGCNALIRSQKANIYTRVEDLEYLLNWEKGQRPVEKPLMDISKFSEDEKKVISILRDFGNGLHLDELSWKSQIAVNAVVSILLNLEFSGAIKSLPGKIYKLAR